jgi:hypothetical protein
MLRSALALLSSLQVGLRIRESIERSVRQTVVIAVAIVVFLFAATIGLLPITCSLQAMALPLRLLPGSSPQRSRFLVCSFLPRYRCSDGDRSAKPCGCGWRRRGPDRSGRRQGDAAGRSGDATYRRLHHWDPRKPPPLSPRTCQEGNYRLGPGQNLTPNSILAAKRSDLTARRPPP